MTLGQPADLFWSFTLREVTVIQAGAQARWRRDHDELAWAVWHIAALPKAKRMPDLAKLKSPPDHTRRPPKQHWKAQAAIMAAWG